jgi:hypothetical protein
MAGFAADGIVEPLDYNLNPYTDVQGTITEPTSLQVQAFQTASAREADRLRRDLGVEDMDEKLSPADVLAFLEKMDPERTRAAVKRQAEMYSALCSGKPTAAQLQKLPHRVMLAFARWLSEELLNPEASAGGTNVTPIRTRAAG